MQPVAFELLVHGLRRKISDMTNHPRQRQSDGRTVRLVVILAAVKKWIAANSVAANDIKRQSLTGQPRRTRHHHCSAQPLGMPRGPSQCLVAADGTADDGEKLTDAEIIQQPPLDFHHVADGDGRKIRAVRFAAGRIEAVWPGRAATAAQQIRTDDKKSVGVHRFARANQNIPPTRIVLRVVAGDMRIAANGMADQNSVVTGGIQFSVSFKSHRDTGQGATRFQMNRSSERYALGIAQRLRGANRVATFKDVFGH